MLVKCVIKLQLRQRSSLPNTGHLVFSTLHTNDAPSAVARLYKMGIEPFLIAYAINVVVAQRLVRTLCKSCKQPFSADELSDLKKFGFTDEDLAVHTFYKAVGAKNVTVAIRGEPLYTKHCILPKRLEKLF